MEVEVNSHMSARGFLQTCLLVLLHVWLSLPDARSRWPNRQVAHSRLSKILIRNQSLFMGPSQGQRAMLGGPRFGYLEILANGAVQKWIKIGIKLSNSWVFLKTKRFCRLQECQSKLLLWLETTVWCWNLLEKQNWKVWKLFFKRWGLPNF